MNLSALMSEDDGLYSFLKCRLKSDFSLSFNSTVLQPFTSRFIARPAGPVVDPALVIVAIYRNMMIMKPLFAVCL